MVCAVLLLACGDTTVGTPPDEDPSPPPLRHGVLSFRVSHNLEDASCLAAGTCSISTNEEDGIRAWLQRVRQDTDLAVLHWNRPLPYHTFAADPPDGTDRVAFYDERLPPRLLDWIDAFADHFEQMPRGYLAVSGLNSRRDRPGPAYTGSENGQPIAEACPTLSPDRTFPVPSPDGAETSITYADAYTNFLLYLYDKLGPDEVGLFVEANLYRKHCPNQWDGFVDLYHAVYDAVRAEVGPDPRLFATLTYLDILDYDLERCVGTPEVESCDGPVGSPSYGPLDPEQCYRLDTAPIRALNEGERLDLLALSAYPDGLLMSVPGGPEAVEFHPPSSTGPSDCQNRLLMPPVVDPWAQLDRIDWDKPVAISETSSRSCPVWQWFDNSSGDGLLRIPGTPTTQHYWLDRALTAADTRSMAFMVQSLYEDYPPIGRDFLQNVSTPLSYNALNLWPCSGLYTADGAPKSGVRSRWLDAVE